MLFRVAVLRALKSASMPDSDRALLVRYALLPRVRGVVADKLCTVDVMEEAEAEMAKAAAAQGLAPAVASIDWSNLAQWLAQNLPAIIALITELVAAIGGKT